VRSYKVSLRDDGLALSYGVFKVSDELLPFARIQEILTKRGILERLMGLASVRIKLAGGKPKRLQGLSPDAADALRDQVMRRPKDEPEAGEP
jgi:membrane protein YdbS with pleckstrin-like domain